MSSTYASVYTSSVYPDAQNTLLSSTKGSVIGSITGVIGGTGVTNSSAFTPITSSLPHTTPLSGTDNVSHSSSNNTTSLLTSTTKAEPIDPDTHQTSDIISYLYALKEPPNTTGTTILSPPTTNVYSTTIPTQNSSSFILNKTATNTALPTLTGASSSADATGETDLKLT